MGSASEALKKYLTGSPGNKKPQILIADDDAAFVRKCKRKLLDCGCGVSVAYTPHEGIEQFARKPFFFDVIFVDLHFPEYGGAEGGWELTEKITSLAERRGYSAAPRLICVTGSEFNELSEATKRHARPLVKGRGAEGIVFEVLHALKFLDELKNGIKLIIRHVSNVQDREYVKPEDKCYRFALEPDSAALVTPDGVFEMRELKDTPLVVLDLLAWASPRGPLRWNELLKKARALPYFKNTLPEALFERDNRDYMKELMYRVRRSFYNVLNDARIGQEVDDILVSYYRDPISLKFVREEQRDKGRDQVKNLRNVYPALKELLAEDKNAYYQLHAWVEIENCCPAEEQRLT